MDNIDEKIRTAKLELASVRRSRWEEEKSFYNIIEELKCGISILRLRMKDTLDTGVDFNVIQTTMQEVNRKNNFSYVALHFGHEALILSVLHHMEVLKSLLKLTAKQCKAMAVSLDESKLELEEECRSLALLRDSKFAEAESFVVDDGLARKVVAQRLVIRKVRSILAETESNDSGNSIPLDTVIQLPVLTSTSYHWSLEGSDLTMESFRDESPRNVKSFVPLSQIEDDVEKLEIQCMRDINLESMSQWELPVQVIPLY